MVARRELQFTPDSLRPRHSVRASVRASDAEQLGYSMGKVAHGTSGVPSPQSDRADRVLAFREQIADAVTQKQRRQKEQRFKAKGIEALGIIAVSIAFSSVAVMALLRLIPYQTAQRDRLDEITAEVQAVEQRVETLRHKFPQMFNSGKSKDALIRQYGFVKPNQIPIKILDSASPKPDNQR